MIIFRFAITCLALAMCHSFAFSQAEQKVMSRRQEPKPPFPYKSFEVNYESAEGVILYATLNIPEGTGPFPAVVLISGSGQSERDVPFAGHKIHYVIADYLTRQGIATLRFDDRGTGKSTTGSKKVAELTSEDFNTDAWAGVQFLMNRAEINPNKIGLYGHSEGTRTAQELAGRFPGKVSFIVLAASSGKMSKGEIVAAQSILLGKAHGASVQGQKADSVFMQRCLQIMRSDLLMDERVELMSQVAKEELIKVPEEERNLFRPAFDMRVQILSSENFYQDARQSQKNPFSNVTCPVLTLNGDKDLMIPAVSAVPNLKASLAESGNKDYEIKLYPDLNHFLQPAKTGTMEEAAQTEETISPLVLNEIAQFIIKRTY